jgi:uncharacterized protein with GYD domain
MEYQSFLDELKRCEFIRDEATADAAGKAVLGILASSMDEGEAHLLTRFLPEPLTLERLRGHQARQLGLTTPQFVEEIRRQFKLRDREAGLLILTVLNAAKAAAQDDRIKLRLDTIAEEVKESTKAGRRIATHIMLTRFSAEAFREPNDFIRIAEQVSRRIKEECPGIRWKESYATLGRFDVVDVVEAEDPKEIERAAMIIRGLGHSTTETLVATPWREFLAGLRAD